jgi:hypothetical protein
MTTSIDIKAFKRLISSTDNYLWQFGQDEALVVRMTKDSYKRSIFLDQRISAVDKSVARYKVDDLSKYYKQVESSPGSCNFIFHVAHCGSTLLSRALDIRKTLVYREPVTLSQMALVAASGDKERMPAGAWESRFELAMAFLSRSYKHGKAPIIKANVPVNFILNDVLASSKNNRALLLYMTLDNYLLAILKTPNQRQWAARISGYTSKGLQNTLKLSGAQLEGLSEPEIVAALWLAQILNFNQVSTAYQNIKAVDSELFFNHPKTVIMEANSLFGQNVSESKVDDIVASELFSSYSKNPNMQFDNSQRLLLKEQLKKDLAPELVVARQWIENYLSAHSIPDVMPNSIGEQVPSLFA